MNSFEAFPIEDVSRISGHVCADLCERATVEFGAGDTVLMVGVQGRGKWRGFAQALRRAADEIEASERSQANLKDVIAAPEASA